MVAASVETALMDWWLAGDPARGDHKFTMVSGTFPLTDTAIKVYFAGPYEERVKLLDRARELETESSGFIHVTSTWLRGEHEALEGIASRHEEEQWAEADRDDIRRSDVFLQFLEVPSTRGGAHYEFGYADALGKTIVTCGPLTNVFHSLPWVIQFDDWAETKVALLDERTLWRNSRKGGLFQ